MRRNRGSAKRPNTEKMRRRKIILLHFLGPSCFYCGMETRTADKLVYNLMTLDHIIPAAHGGGHDVTNFVIACHTCNNKRGTKAFEDYIISVLDKMSYEQRQEFYQRYDAHEEFTAWYIAADVIERRMMQYNISDETRQLAMVA